MSPSTIHPPVSAARFGSPLNRVTPPSEHDKIVKQAQKWVAQTFYGTLLKQIRNSPFHSELFEGGRGGEAFGALYDQQLADHMARGSGQKLVNAIARRIEGNAAYRNTAAKGARHRTPDTQRLMNNWSSHVAANLRA